MMLQHLVLPCRTVDMSINLRCGNALMAQHLLNHSQIRPMLYQMGSKGMAESMRRYLLGYPDRPCLVLYHIEHGHPAQRLPEPVEKQYVGILGFCRKRTDQKIIPYRLSSHIPDRNQSLLVSLADYPDKALVQIKAGYSH